MSDSPSSEELTGDTSSHEIFNTTTMQEVDEELNEDQVSKFLSDLGPSATGLQFSYLCFSAPGCELKNVSILCNYVYLQKLELPNNKIQDLSCVSHMPHLIILDASHNNITDFFGFQPPKSLKEVNFSHNQISEMKELSGYYSLIKLNLDYNFISEIRGLEECESLAYLSLAHNNISHISGLDHLPLRELSLKENTIEKIENLQNVLNLQLLDLSYNRIQCLSGLQNLQLLGVINLDSNLVSEIKEASHLHDLKLLRELNLLGNPVQDKEDYRVAVIFLLQHVTSLDLHAATAEEKVFAVNKYDPPLEVKAARDHMTHMVYQLMQPQVIFDSTQTSLETPYPMLILTGSQACGKRELAHKLCQEFSDYFAYCACHTSRGPYYGEEDGLDYHFVTEAEFINMTQMGLFVQTMRYGGHWYGLSRESIECVAREGLACCVHMELEGVYSMKNTFFEPRYVLLIPTSPDKHIDCMEARGFYSSAQIETAVSRLDLYCKTNTEKPGFFDGVINCDDRADAYNSLKKLVKEFLRLDQDADERSSLTPNNSTISTTGEFRAVSTDGTADLVNAYSRTYKIQAQQTPDTYDQDHRRRQLLLKALSGKRPGAYAELFQRSAANRPSSLTKTHGPSSSPKRPVGLGGPDLDEDSSSEEFCAGSGLSVTSSARIATLGSDAGPSKDPSSMSIVGQGRDSLKGPKDWNLTPDAPRSLYERFSPSSPNRPGANVKPVLPPIPSGRRTNGSNP